MSLDRSGGLILADDDLSGTTGDVVGSVWSTLVADRIDARWSELDVSSTGSVNNLSITSGGREADVIRCTNATALTLTGIAAPASPAKPGKRLIIYSVGAGQVNLADQSGSSTAANRIITGVGGQIELAAGFGRVTLEYDDVADRWRVIHHEQGAPIAYTPTWGNTGTANSLGNGTLAGSYYRRGKQIFFTIALTWGSTTSSGNGNWSFTVPATAESLGPFLGHTFALDSSAGQAYVGSYSQTSTTVIAPVTLASPVAAVTSSVPFTWANGDSYTIRGWYFTA